jgi:hypothetical protein
MNKAIFSVAVLALLGCATPSSAGIYSDDMAKCLVRSMTPSDQTAFIQWIFSAIALHPDVSALANISPAQHIAYDKKAAELFDRMMTEDCRKETVTAIKYEGGAAVEASFSTLGQVAMRGLMSDQTVAQGISNLDKYTDKSKMEAVIKEAGITLPPPKK